MGKFIRLPKFKEPTEQDLFNVYKELNYGYFNNSIHVDRIRFSKFIADAVYGTVTYGLFMYDPVKMINEIHINKLLLGRYIIRAHPWLPEIVMHHEMCHAMMALNTHSQRHGLFTCDDHGPEFQKLMDMHPLSKKAERLLAELSDTIMGETLEFSKRFIAKHPDFKLKRVFLRPMMPLPGFMHVLPEDIQAELKQSVSGDLKDLLEKVLEDLKLPGS